MHHVFESAECRDILRTILQMARPGVFGAVAQLNRHCWVVAAPMILDKLAAWSHHVYDMNWPQYCCKVLIHNGRRHGRVMDTGWTKSETIFNLDNCDCRFNRRIIRAVSNWSGVERQLEMMLRGPAMGYAADTIVNRSNYAVVPIDGAWSSDMYRDYRMRYNFEAGLRHGEQHVYYNNGRLRETGTFVRGVRHGEFRSWYKAGQLYISCTYDHGRLHGELWMWSTSGRPLLWRGYKHGKKDGAEYHWYVGPAQQLYQAAIYRDGLLCGPYMTWYNNGERESYRGYRRGRPHGPARQWYRNGTMMSYLRYRRGVQIGSVRV